PGGRTHPNPSGAGRYTRAHADSARGCPWPCNLPDGPHANPRPKGRGTYPTRSISEAGCCASGRKGERAELSRPGSRREKSVADPKWLAISVQSNQTDTVCGQST